MKLLNDDWLHIGALLAIAIGAADAFLTAAGVLQHPAFTHDVDLLLMTGGFAGLGIKIVNGLAAIARTTNYPSTPGTAAAAPAAGKPATAPPAAGPGGS